MARIVAQDYGVADGPALLKVVAEELKLPLMHIARQAELSRLTGAAPEIILGDVEAMASDALALIDSYVFGLELIERQQMLELEPVSLAAVLYDTAHGLERMAKQYNVELQLHIGGSYQPVMAHRAGLQAALLSLGSVFIEAQSIQELKTKSITLAAYRTKSGLAAGVYSQAGAITPAELKLACAFRGRARQPLSQFSSGAAAGVFAANSILQAMAAKLRTSRYERQAGLGTVLLLSRQLQLV